MAWNKDINGNMHEFYRCYDCRRLVTMWQVRLGLHVCPRCEGRRVKEAIPRWFEKIFLFFNSKY